MCHNLGNESVPRVAVQRRMRPRTRGKYQSGTEHARGEYHATPQTPPQTKCRLCIAE